MSKSFLPFIAISLIPCLLVNPAMAVEKALFERQSVVPPLAGSVEPGAKRVSAFVGMYRRFKDQLHLDYRDSTVTVSMFGTGELYLHLQILVLPVILAAFQRYRSSRLFQFRSEAVREAALAAAESITDELRLAIDQTEDWEKKKVLKDLFQRLEKSPLARSALHRWPERLTLRSPERREEVQRRVRALYAAEFYERMMSEHRHELEGLARGILNDPMLEGIPEEELRQNGLPQILMKFIERKVLSDTHVERTTEGAFRVFAFFSQTHEFQQAVKVFFWKEYEVLQTLVEEREENPVKPGTELPEEIRALLLDSMDRQISAVKSRGPVQRSIRESVEGLVTDAVSKIPGYSELAEGMLTYFQTRVAEGTDMEFYGMTIPNIPYTRHINRLDSALRNHHGPPSANLFGVGVIQWVVQKYLTPLRRSDRLLLLRSA